MDQAMHDEFALHLELRAEDLVRRGMAPADAARQARIEFGNVTTAKETARASWRTAWLDRLGQDTRYSLRVLRHNPGFTVVALLSLGLGIGATTTVFSVIDAVDFRALPFEGSDRLVWLAELAPADADFCPNCPFFVASATAANWKSQLRSVNELAGASPGSFSWRHDDAVEYVPALEATPNFLPLLGAKPILGRGFVEADALPGAEPVAIVTNSFWQARLAGTTDLATARIGSGEQSVRVVGVLPGGFHFRGDASIWRPTRLDPNGSRTNRRLALVGRLREGASVASAAAEVETIESRLAAAYSKPYDGWGATVKPLREFFTTFAGKGRFAVFAFTTLVLCIAVFNVAGLLLARAVSRRDEFALRSALGASRGRLVGQMLIEGCCIGLGGGGIGVALAAAAVRVAPRWLSAADTGLVVGIDGRMLLFAAALSLVVGLAASLAPALRVARTDLGGRLRSTSRVTGRASTALVVMQIAMALVLLTAAGLLGRDFLELRYLDIGYDPDNLYSTSIPSIESADLRAWAAVAEQMRVRVAAIPGVVAASLEHRSAIHPAIVKAADVVAPRPLAVTPVVSAVDDDYFQVLGGRLLGGRNFSAVDAPGAPLTAIVNKSAASALWPGQFAVGHKLYIADSAADAELLTVIGVVDDMERGELSERHWPMVYRPFRQARIYHRGGSLQLRFARGAGGAIRAAQTAIHETTGQPARPFESASDRLRERLFPQRVNAIALQIFSLFGLLLAAMGIYGTVSYAVTSRTREIGIRLALGARRHSVIALMARGGLVLAGSGVAIGITGSLALVRVLRSMMEGTTPSPWVYAVAAVVMITAAFFATLWPASRAASIDAVASLRAQ
jgi:predicted permease